MIELNEKSSDLTKSSKIFNKQALNKKASSENTISKKNSNREANKLISEEKQILKSIIRSAEEKYKNRQTSIKYRKNLEITA